MNAEDLLLSTKSLLDLQKMQAEMEGRDFSVVDAMAAVRPALESVLSELIDLQRGPDVSARCPHCGENLVVQFEDVFDDYDNMDVQQIIDDISSGEFTAEELKTIHQHEKQDQGRSSILSAVSAAYSLAANGMKLTDEDKHTHAVETERKLDKMFDDLFKPSGA
jgi:hypothetical protein